MNPIINPLVFYVIDVCEAITQLAQVCGVLLAACTMVETFLVFDFIQCATDEDAAKAKKILKTSVIALLVVIVIYIVVPSQETMYTMLVSSYVTEDNISHATEAVKDGVDYLFDKLNDE